MLMETYQIPHILPLGVVEISIEVLAACIISVPFYPFLHNLLFQPFHLKREKQELFSTLTIKVHVQTAYTKCILVITQSNQQFAFFMKIFIKYLAMLTISHNVCRTLKLHFNSNVNALCKRIFLHVSSCEIKMVKIKGRTQV